MAKSSIQNYPSQRGFTLIEISIVLSIIALILSSALTVIAGKMEDNRLKVTKERMEHVKTAIKQYVDDKGHLPCPASGAREVTEAEFGRGIGSGVGSPNYCTDEDFDSTGAINTSVVQGVIPTATLNIDPIYMLDGWNRRITYAVTHNMTFNSSYAANTGLIEVLNEDGEYLTTRAAITSDNGDSHPQCDGSGNSSSWSAGDCIGLNAAMIIISHGPNGFGAWRLKGGTRINDSRSNTEATMENDNCHYDNALDETYRFMSLRTEEGATPTNMGDQIFDDIVMYWTKWELDK